ncbi:MAG TPA: protease inhibitor I42 family protein [Mycobacteriales bacterium]|jgi:predicted secreted protein|nr:protease inhibitor I42 family protein [Mycobacteriales bacterium]
MKPRLAPFVGALASALLAASTGTATAHVVSHKPTVFHRSSSGMTVSMKKGKTFKVSLHGCGDCGDYWSYGHRPDRKVLAKAAKTRTVSEAPPGAVGGTDHRVWTFKAVGRGTTTMRMVEHSASHHNKVIARFTLTVKVA